MKLPHIFTAILIIVAAGLGAGAAVGLRGLAGDQSTAPVGLHSLLEAAAPLVVYSEFGETADTLWAANPDDPSDRTQLGQIEHARGFAISPRLSPDGARIAYTVVPPTGAQAAELWVLDIESAEARRLAGGVDLLSAPVWSPKADAVVVRRSQGGEDEAGSAQLLRVDLSGATTVLASAAAGLYPIEFSPDGAWLYFAVLSASGTDLARVSGEGGDEPQTVAPLSDGIARDWRLSPDGTRLAYLAQTDGAGFAARVLDISTGKAVTPLAHIASAQFSPVWTPDGDLAIGQLSDGGAALLVSGEGASLAPAAQLPGPEGGDGFDAPLSWSPGGAHLAVRSFAGESTADPGPSWVVVVGTDGERNHLSSISDVTIAGWLVP